MVDIPIIKASCDRRVIVAHQLREDVMGKATKEQSAGQNLRRTRCEDDRSSAQPKRRGGVGSRRSEQGEKLREMDGALRPGDGWKMEVTDGRGETVYILTFASEACDRGKR